MRVRRAGLQTTDIGIPHPASGRMPTPMVSPSRG
jgi:hypothetical protein